MKKEYNSIYLGIVVQNNDPKKRGRVKVFIPDISPAVHGPIIGDNTNKSFSNINADLNPILKELKRTLPWAETAQPLTSENSSTRFNNFANHTSVSDSNKFENFLKNNTASSGELYDQSNFRLNDEFNDNAKNVNNPNPYSYMYKPNTYSNKAKGSFGVPSVGSHVYVFFRNGNTNFPVILASSFGKDDWQGIYDNEVDYPGKFENFDAEETDADENVKTYRNKYVLNQKGGTIEIGNTDFNEKVRLTQYSGSFKEMNNNTNIELATKNDQKLVMADSYDTTKGFRNIYTGKNLDEIILRDKYKKVGNLNNQTYQSWKELFSEIQDTKQLFEKQRTLDNSKRDTSGKTIVSLNSVKQTKRGEHAPFPVTTTNKILALDNVNNFEDSNFQPIATVINQSLNYLLPVTVDSNQIIAAANVPFPGPKFATASSNENYTKETGLPLVDGKSPSTAQGNFNDDPNVLQLKNQLITQLENLMNLEKELGLGGNEIVEIGKNKIETIGMVMNDFGSIRLDPVGKLITSEMIVGTNGVYQNQEGAPLIEYVDVQDMPGGSYNLNVTNKYNLVVGAGGMSLKSYGPTNIVGTVTNVGGEQVNIASDNDINIDGDVVTISADILKLRNKRQRQVYVEGSIGVQNNIIVGGGLHVEGEASFQHITMPGQVNVTTSSKAFGQPTGGSMLGLPPGQSCVIGFIPAGTVLGAGEVTGNAGTCVINTLAFTKQVPIMTNALDTVGAIAKKLCTFPDANSIEIYSHSHATLGPAITLTDGNRSVRNNTINSKMSHGCNVPATPQFNTELNSIPIKLS